MIFLGGGGTDWYESQVLDCGDCVEEDTCHGYKEHKKKIRRGYLPKRTTSGNTDFRNEINYINNAKKKKPRNLNKPFENLK